MTMVRPTAVTQASRTIRTITVAAPRRYEEPSNRYVERTMKFMFAAFPSIAIPKSNRIMFFFATRQYDAITRMRTVHIR